MARDHWNTGTIEAIAARWKALEALDDAARKFLAHVVALVPHTADGHDGLIYLDDMPEVVMMRAGPPGGVVQRPSARFLLAHAGT